MVLLEVIHKFMEFTTLVFDCDIEVVITKDLKKTRYIYDNPNVSPGLLHFPGVDHREVAKKSLQRWMSEYDETKK